MFGRNPEIAVESGNHAGEASEILTGFQHAPRMRVGMIESHPIRQEHQYGAGGGHRGDHRVA
jgi:hypothetical protein